MCERCGGPCRACDPPGTLTAAEDEPRATILRLRKMVDDMLVVNLELHHAAASETRASIVAFIERRSEGLAMANETLAALALNLLAHALRDGADLRKEGGK